MDAEKYLEMIDEALPAVDIDVEDEGEEGDEMYEHFSVTVD